MRKGFTVRMAWGCFGTDNFLVVANDNRLNEVVNYPMDDYNNFTKFPQDIGMWKIKTLKK